MASAHTDFLVLDDFLDEDTWTALWTDFQFVELHPVSRSVGAWKLDDGVPLGGEELVIARDAAQASGSKEAAAEDHPLAQLVAAVAADCERHRSVVDEGWDRIAVRPYVYPHGTGLSWHVDDHELYAGAFIYYAHPHWNAHWGGELLVAEAPQEPGEELPIMGYRFETEGFSERLLEVGAGRFVMPKPNRLVVLGGAPHMVARVSAAAGAAVRASVSGFFLRPRADVERDDV